VSRTARRAALPVLAFLLTVLPVAAHAQAPADSSADSTRIERWTLPNGLRVVARWAPGARMVAMTLGYRAGMDDDPAGRAGLAQLLGDLAFTAPAGELPARDPAEMGSLRPLGWSYPVLRHVTLHTELADTDRFPIVLDQMARRMRDATADEASLKAARTRVKAELVQQLFGAPTQVLNHQIREIAAGRTDAQMVAHASGADLDKVTVREAQAALRKWFVPANAVLSLAGDFGAVDVRRLVEQRFGAIPGGAAHPDPPAARLRAATRSLKRSGPASGAIGVLAPALTDSTHPAFYMAAMVLGSMCEDTWNRGVANPQPRFQFALVDEPEMMRLFPPVPEDETDPGRLVYRLRAAAEQLPTLIIPEPQFVRLRTSVSTVLGGPMPAEQRAALRGNPGILHTLARGQATCELRMGAAFWDEYRRRLERVRPAHVSLWREWMNAPENEVVLLLTPKPQ
jgi:hypothetical protein